MYALIKKGKVVNVILADAAFIAEQGDALAEGGQWLKLEPEHNVKGQQPGPGWTFDGVKFAPVAGV